LVGSTPCKKVPQEKIEASMSNSVADKILTVFVLMAFLGSTSCTSTRVISTRRVIQPNPDTIQDQLREGNVVTIYTKDGQNFEFRVVSVSSEAITGVRFDEKKVQQILPLTEIDKIELAPRYLVRQTSDTASTLFIVGVAVVATVALVYLLSWMFRISVLLRRKREKKLSTFGVRLTLSTCPSVSYQKAPVVLQPAVRIPLVLFLQ
jgi:hypothetical protein